ncbi:MAG: DUF493 family protein [Flavobacteriia bacterium]|nr:DUF493 family protein [Flavobacteriia bacterium]
MSDPFVKLREQLALQEWPNVYLFKFIVPNESDLLAKVMSLFGEVAEIALHESKTGKYISVSAKEVMVDVDSIIEIYIRAAEIKGLIAL